MTAGEETEKGPSLPENASAAEMRRWADMMLGRRAAQAATQSESSTTTLEFWTPKIAPPQHQSLTHFALLQLPVG